MSLDKAILSGKERRRPYYRSGRHDKTFRPNGGCPWCRRNRVHSEATRKLSAAEQIKEVS